MPIVAFATANIGVYSFSKDVEKPLSHYEFDLTNFRDPMNKSMFNGCEDGRSIKVQEWVREDERFPAILASVIALAHDAREHNNKRWITFGFRDFHGKWKSRAVAELVAEELSKLGHNVCISHLTPEEKK